MTLLDKAQANKTPSGIRDKRTKHPDAQLVELALAWMRGEIRNADLCAALGRKPHAIGGCITTVMNALRRATAAGKVKIESRP